MKTVTLYVIGLLISTIIFGGATQVYATANTSDELIIVGLQAPLDGSILQPSTNSHEYHDGIVFIYRCPQHTAGTAPVPSGATTSGTGWLRPTGNMAKAGYIFVGWRNGNHIFQPWQAFILPEGDSHFYFYAVWAPVVLLTFHSNNGTGTAQTTRRAAGIPMRHLPQPSNPGYNFLGWFTTPEETGGSRLSAPVIAPTSNTEYWARWGAPINLIIYYENIVNVDTTSALSFVDTSINEIKGLFLSGFDIELVQRPGTTRYVPALNHVGTYASDILDINPSNDTTVIFRFVDFLLNDGLIAGRARPVRGMEGTPQMHLGDMVITTMLSQEMFRRAVVHEISHIFGAHDCNNFRCVMDISRYHTIHNNWCASCRSDIHNYLHIRVRNNPHLMS